MEILGLSIMITAGIIGLALAIAWVIVWLSEKIPISVWTPISGLVALVFFVGAMLYIVH